VKGLRSEARIGDDIAVVQALDRGIAGEAAGTSAAHREGPAAIDGGAGPDYDGARSRWAGSFAGPGGYGDEGGGGRGLKRTRHCAD
jgi:hypothetical protein